MRCALRREAPDGVYCTVPSVSMASMERSLVIQALRRRPLTLYGDGLQVRDVLFVEDLVDAMQLAHARIDGISGQAFNIGGGPGHTISLLELIDVLGEMFGERPLHVIEPWR